MKKISHPHLLKNGLARASKIHFLLLLAYVAQLIAYDASKLITPEVVRDRWIAVAMLTGVVVAVYYLSSTVSSRYTSYKFLTWLLILADIAFAAFNVYTQRGMSSRAVLLFVIPIILSTLLFSRVALFSTAILCIAVYTTTAVAYFVNNFNEGYKIELYGEIIFYSVTFLVCAGLLWASLKAKRAHND